MSRYFVSIAAMLLAASVFAAELLPFPESVQQGQFVDQGALKKFGSRISNLDCAELIELRKGLAQRRSESTTTADFNYYNNRWKVVITIIEERACK